jgi:hypothetical protein
MSTAILSPMGNFRLREETDVAKRNAKKLTKRAMRTKAMRTKTTAKKSLRRRADATLASGPSLPLRDLVRGGIPRSPKAHRPPSAVTPTPWGQRRMKTAHGMKSGSTLVQNPPGPREWLGVMKAQIPKR